MLRGYCFAFSAVFRETCDRREVPRLSFLPRRRDDKVLRLLKKITKPVLVLSLSLTRLTMSPEGRLVDAEDPTCCRQFR